MEIFQFAQGTPEWHDIRRGVITGTRLKSAIGSPAVRKTLIIELLAEAMCDRDENSTNVSTYGMEHGNAAESVIKEFYCTDKQVSEVGFIKKYDWLGLSPDGVVFEGENIVEGIEVKSPAEKNWVKWALEGGIPDEHEAQVLQYFIVIDTLERLTFKIINEHVKIKDLRIIEITVTREQLKEKIENAKHELLRFKNEWDTAKQTLLTKLQGK